MTLRDISLALQNKASANNMSIDDLNSLLDRYPFSCKLRSLRIKQNLDSSTSISLDQLGLTVFSSNASSVIETLFSFPAKEDLILNPSENIIPEPNETDSTPIGKSVSIKNKEADIIEEKNPIEKTSLHASIPELDHLSDYSSWLLQLKQTNRSEKVKPSDKIATPSIESEVNNDQKVDVITDKSSELNSEIVSESLANLLADQGHSKKAKEMYTKLSLIFPEKSAYFASQIEKIKGK